jgi:hypothetical protein
VNAAELSQRLSDTDGQRLTTAEELKRTKAELKRATGKAAEQSKRLNDYGSAELSSNFREELTKSTPDAILKHHQAV